MWINSKSSNGNGREYTIKNYLNKISNTKLPNSILGILKDEK